MKPGRAQRWLSFRQTRRGAIIIGLLAGCMIALQGIAYKEAYPDASSQAQFAASLKTASSLGLLYGDPDDLDHGVNGYVVYRVVAFVSFIIALWGLMTMTKLLRGNEEDGRWETVRAGALTARAATLHSIVGFLGAFLLSFAISTIITMSMAVVPGIELSFGLALFINLALFAPALLFAALGILVSQLAVTRRRALMYGLLPLLIAFVVRGIGNTNPDQQWLLFYTPFGWNQLMSPIIAPEGWWLAAFGLLTLLFSILGWTFAHRDLGSSVIPERSVASSRFYLLGSAWQLALRQNIWVLGSWALGALIMTGIIASLVTVAAQATAESPALSQSVTALASNAANLKTAFLGAGLIFVVMTLMIMGASVVAAIRHDEAKQYLDTILVSPERRLTWLFGRLGIGITALLATSLACGLAIMVVGASQDIGLEFWKVMAHSLVLSGTVILLLGLGILIFGLLPRFSVIVMYIALTWSFLVDLIDSVLSIPDAILKSSLFHYTSFNLSEWPDWETFTWLISLGIVLMIGGIYFFNRRDIIPE